MGPDQIRSAYILYIGAGAVAAGGIISLAAFAADDLARRAGRPADLRGGGGGRAHGSPAPRTERDLSMKVVLIGSLVLRRRHHRRAVRCT